ncbi:MAG TPA: phosphopantothenoylcysteine decarboxylase, partial [Agriterribacter sp.]|nr:phosphopantothenoylcysteine decarboxylase [Agriterribacter sp.]
AEFLNKESSRDMAGKRALVTAGPTYEAIDPVRFIGNHSSGKMGVVVARELLQCGADVTLVLGPVPGTLELDGLHVIKVQSAGEMYDACHSVFAETDITVMAAAVADYTPVAVAPGKIKKKEENWSVALKKTPDILKSLGQKKTGKQVLAGFALETSHERENALAKLQQKNADIIVLNSLRDSGAGFGTDTNKITVFDRNGAEKSFGLKSKAAVAKDIVDHIIEYIHA